MDLEWSDCFMLSMLSRRLLHAALRAEDNGASRILEAHRIRQHLSGHSIFQTIFILFTLVLNARVHHYNHHNHHNHNKQEVFQFAE